MPLFFEDNTTEQERTYYKELLRMMGSLSNLFSENTKPYLPSRATENIFCKALGAENLARGDVTADAMKNRIGVGIKTWIGNSNQKIAEFNALKHTYENDPDEEMIRKIATYRNERINFTFRTYDLHDMIYHCTIRDINTIKIVECPMTLVDIPNIQHVGRRGRNRNVIYFDDGYNEYSFNISKSTLYKRFDDVEELANIDVDIIDDPFTYLAECMHIALTPPEPEAPTDMIYLESAVLPLYSTRRLAGKYVPEKNNLNMRFAGGRPRDIYEVGIPIPADFRNAHPNFFMGINYPFELILPNGNSLLAKQCQQDGKALMSNPNSALGHWLIDEVLEISPETRITYDLLARYGIDAVKLDKFKNTETNTFVYKINFARTGSYEYFMQTGQAGGPTEEEMEEADLYE